MEPNLRKLPNRPRSLLRRILRRLQRPRIHRRSHIRHIRLRQLSLAVKRREKRRLRMQHIKSTVLDGRVGEASPNRLVHVEHVDVVVPRVLVQGGAVGVAVDVAWEAGHGV